MILKVGWNSFLTVLLCSNSSPKGDGQLCCGLQARGGGGGGGGVLDTCGPAPHTLTLFKKKIADFPTALYRIPILIPCLRHS